MLIRLGLLFRTPLHQVRDWPASDVRLLSRFLARQPAPEERIEYALAQLSSMYANANRRQGTAARPLGDFLLFAKAFAAEDADFSGSRYSDVDRSLFKQLMG